PSLPWRIILQYRPPNLRGEDLFLQRLLLLHRAQLRRILLPKAIPMPKYMEVQLRPRFNPPGRNSTDLNLMEGTGSSLYNTCNRSTQTTYHRKPSPRLVGTLSTHTTPVTNSSKMLVARSTSTVKCTAQLKLRQHQTPRNTRRRNLTVDISQVSWKKRLIGPRR